MCGAKGCSVWHITKAMQIANVYKNKICLIIEAVFQSLRRLCVLPVGLVTNANCTGRAA